MMAKSEKRAWRKWEETTRQKSRMWGIYKIPRETGLLPSGLAVPAVETPGH